MSRKPLSSLTVVVPVYNEQAGLASFHESLIRRIDSLGYFKFDVIYCNDGSTDGSLERLKSLTEHDKRVQILSLTRNFGKEVATTAGINLAKGDGIITIDADGQHPVELIPELINEWHSGAKVVIGLRTDNSTASLIKRSGSTMFYRLFNRLTGLPIVAGGTDFRLIDKVVQADFARLTERNRITRGLIDWLGYQRVYVPFSAKPRLHDDSGYSIKKLFKLAIDSVISMSSSPLYVTAYIGAIVLPLSLLLGLVMAINGLFGDPLGWHATGGAYIIVLMLSLIGVVLMSQGIIGLYLSHIHSESLNRPLYVIDTEASVIK
ncbi:MAG: glycosyltransferase family 2 protein [Patescibacteria group bacterium]